MKKLAIVFGALLFPFAAYATPLVQFSQTSTGNTISATTSAGNTATTIAGSAQVNVSQDLGGLLGLATLTLDAMSNGAAFMVGTGVFQHYDGTFLLQQGGVDILSGSFTDAAFGAGPSIGISIGAPPDTLTLHSDIIPASELGLPAAITFSLSNVTPLVHIVGSTLADFTSTIAGNASASTVNVPEPGSLAVLGIGVAGLAFIKRRRPSSSLKAAA
jgi:hypothetical protein